MTALERDTLIEAHLKVVRQETYRAGRRAPKFVCKADLYGAGVVGLVQSADRWRPETGVPFEAYARRRVRGAILDYMRNEDPCSRAERKRARDAGESVKRTVFSLDAYIEFLQTDGGDEAFAVKAPDAERPDIRYEHRDRVARFERLLNATPNTRHRLALILLCSHPADRVAEMVGYTAGRVSQLKQEARQRAQALGLA